MKRALPYAMAILLLIAMFMGLALIAGAERGNGALNGASFALSDKDRGVQNGSVLPLRG